MSCFFISYKLSHVYVCSQVCELDPRVITDPSETQTVQKTHLEFKKQISHFGCNSSCVRVQLSLSRLLDMFSKFIDIKAKLTAINYDVEKVLFFICFCQYQN